MYIPRTLGLENTRKPWKDGEIIRLGHIDLGGREADTLCGEISMNQRTLSNSEL